MRGLRSQAEKQKSATNRNPVTESREAAILSCWQAIFNDSAFRTSLSIQDVLREVRVAQSPSTLLIGNFANSSSLSHNYLRVPHARRTTYPLCLLCR